MSKFLGRALLAIVLVPFSVSVLLVALLRWLPPPTTSFMLQSPVRPVDYRWVAKGQIADVARKAVVASEDQLFWEHHGFDVEAMQKAYENNRKRRKIRGGFTISQQTAKNLFLWQGGGYARKGIEAYFTVLIEAFWPKARILEVYLNIAEFGPGVYGVEAASRRYLGKPAGQLSAADAARLIAVLPSPRHWRAAAPGPYVQSRSAWILRQIGYGTPAVNDEEPEAPSSGDISQDTDDSATVQRGDVPSETPSDAAAPAPSNQSEAPNDSTAPSDTPEPPPAP